jgi:5-amino-6-(5-phosphoribosylamino)uracil reductase
MQVILSTTISLDGFLDHKGPSRLILSSDEDLIAVHNLRTTVSAILVGAETIRKDNPQLNVRKSNLPVSKDPIKVTITNSGNLDLSNNFFSVGETDKIVFCGSNVPDHLLDRLTTKATVIESPLNTPLTAHYVIERLESLGVESLLIEGGAKIQAMFMSAGLVDLIRLGISPLILGKDGLTQFNCLQDIEKNYSQFKSEKLGHTAISWYNKIPLYSVS